MPPRPSSPSSPCTYWCGGAIDVSWLRPVFLFNIVGQLSWLGISFYADVAADILYYIVIIALWCMMLYYSWNFRPVTMEPEPAVGLVDEAFGEHAAASPAHPTLPQGVLERLMDEEELYLRPDLTLTDLAQALGTNRTYVSNYLSQMLHQTFYDYINQLRIERMSKPLLREHPELQTGVRGHPQRLRLHVHLPPRLCPLHRTNAKAVQPD